MADSGAQMVLAGRQMPNEDDRLAALADLHVTEGGPEATFDRIARIGCAALRFPTAHITLISRDLRIAKNHDPSSSDEIPRNQSICNFTIQGYEPLVIPDTLLDERVRDFAAVKKSHGIRAYWGMPLTTRRGYNLGAFCVLDTVPRHPTQADIEVLRDLARLTVECMELRAQARVDVLTGAASRRALYDEGGRLFNRLSDEDRMGCILLDIDHFKLINDNLGHAKGDDVLRDLAVLIHSDLRNDTPFGRIGGEEFVILLQNEGLAGAYAVAERLRRLLEATRVAGLQITASFGVSERLPGDASLADVLARADEQAYEAKRAGRNCTRPVLLVEG
ncbi:MAG: sensor domain-containing diguanylate cyclase [Bordetella sp.]